MSGGGRDAHALARCLRFAGGTGSSERRQWRRGCDTALAGLNCARDSAPLLEQVPDACFTGAPGSKQGDVAGRRDCLNQLG